jgi:hypothetical protein
MSAPPVPRSTANERDPSRFRPEPAANKNLTIIAPSSAVHNLCNLPAVHFIRTASARRTKSKSNCRATFAFTFSTSTLHDGPADCAGCSRHSRPAHTNRNGVRSASLQRAAAADLLTVAPALGASAPPCRPASTTSATARRDVRARLSFQRR